MMKVNRRLYIIFIAFILVFAILFVIKIELEKQPIVYLTNKYSKNFAIFYDVSLYEKEKYIIKPTRIVPSSASNKENVVWVDYDFLINSPNQEAEKVRELLDSGSTILFIKDNISRKELVEALSLKTEYQELDNRSSMVRCAVKVSKKDNRYMFHDVFVGSDAKIGTQYQTLIYAGKLRNSL